MTMAKPQVCADHPEVPCCTPGCPETVPAARAALFPDKRAPCLVCGARHAAAASLAKSKSVVVMHKSSSTYVSPTPAGREFVKHVAQMRRGTGGE